MKVDETPKKQRPNQDELEKGDCVLIKHQTTGRWNKEAEVVEQREDKLLYVIKTTQDKSSYTDKDCSNQSQSRQPNPTVYCAAW